MSLPVFLAKKNPNICLLVFSIRYVSRDKIKAFIWGAVGLFLGWLNTGKLFTC